MAVGNATASGRTTPKPELAAGEEETETSHFINNTGPRMILFQLIKSFEPNYPSSFEEMTGQNDISFGDASTCHLSKALTGVAFVFKLCHSVFTLVLNGALQQFPFSIIKRKCKYHEVFPSEAKVKGDPMLDMTILNYTRTEIMFSIISLCIMIMGLFFSIYTFNNPRYTFKRLAGGIHFISCLSIFVVIEILMQSIDYEKEFLPVVHPSRATYHYGFSFILAWVVLLLNLFSGVAFMWYSKKRKGDKAPNEEVAMANEPTIIGR